MKITDIRIRLNPDAVTGYGVLGTADVTIDDAVAVHDIRILRREEKIFLAMPSRRCADGQMRDLVHPIHTEVRTELTEAVLTAYRRQETRRRLSLCNGSVR